MRSLGLFFIVLWLGRAAEPRTLRLDYFHGGDAVEAHFSLDGIALEGPWSGRLDRAIDDTNLGKYYFEVSDRRTNRVLYSRGFASIFGEWEETAEAKEVRRQFHESLRFPAPSTPVQVVMKKRDRHNAFREVWSTIVDPADPSIDRSGPPSGVKAWPVVHNGESRDKVDLLLMGDGYTAAEMENGTRRPTAWRSCCLRSLHSKSAVRISMSARSILLPTRAASPGRRTASIASRLCGPPTTPSARNVTF